MEDTAKCRQLFCASHVRIHKSPDVTQLNARTSVKIYLPRHSGGEAQAVREEAHGRLQTGSSDEVVLVVEDEERVRKYSVEALEELGYTVIAADGPRAALKFIEAGAAIDLLFTDAVMPDMNGRQLAERVMERLPRLKVVFCHWLYAQRSRSQRYPGRRHRLLAKAVHDRTAGCKNPTRLRPVVMRDKLWVRRTAPAAASPLQDWSEGPKAFSRELENLGARGRRCGR